MVILTSHLIIGDPHCKPGVFNKRFEYLGNFIIDKQPNVIICLGDFADMESLCSYDKNKKSFEGRRYKNDMAAVHQALELINEPTKHYNEQQKKNKKTQYKPRKIMLLGNHEQRIERAVECSPELEGTIGFDDLKYKNYGWEVIPFTIPIQVGGIYYSHFFPSGIKGDAITGVNVASNILTKIMLSATVGHNHLFDYATKALPNGKRIHGLSAGCFADSNNIEQYALNTQYMWWHGLVLKHNVQNGEYDLEVFSMKRLQGMYGE